MQQWVSSTASDRGSFHGDHMRVRRWAFRCLPGVLMALALTVWWLRTPAFTDACKAHPAGGLVVCALSDMTRVTRAGSVPDAGADFNIAQGAIRLHAARNETLGFQILLRTLAKPITEALTLTHTEWRSSIRSNSTAAPVHTQMFAAHYHHVRHGGYTWGPRSKVLDWPADYPDALVPQYKQCGGNTQHLFTNIELPPAHHNQSVWVDVHVPRNLPVGHYSQSLRLTLNQMTLDIPVALQVHSAQLPDLPTIDAVGEIYRSYRLEGVGENRSVAAWQRMSQCYQQLAHQHRLVFLERTPEPPQTDIDWQHYYNTYNPALTGELFSEERGYTGPGRDTPVAIWRTPWPQAYDVSVERPLDASELNTVTVRAEEWSTKARAFSWQNTRFFAYLFDEVDGPMKIRHPTDKQRRERQRYIARVHHDMGQLQRAIDKGSPSPEIDLLWTSHSNPSIWRDDPELDLTGKVRLWAPNASAADTGFLTERQRAGERAWFYHSGHPAVGVHSINASGIEMRTWGVVSARYGMNGHFMWAVNLGNDDRPFAEPSYKPDDDRFGNGVMVYPGNQLPRIGYPRAPGPVPSMRLKMWRRGLQDAELFYLARQKHPQEAERLMKDIMPAALTEAAAGEPAQWTHDEIQWREFQLSLLKLASQGSISAPTRR